jgi:uncharacterized membrane protein YraQ (UPF0718 family)
MLTFIISLNITALLLILISALKDRAKTQKAFRIALQSGKNMLPILLLVIVFIGILLSWIPNAWIQKYLGQSSGFWGVLGAGLIGSVVMMQSFIAYPLASSLLNSGASLSVIATFLTTLTMIGTASLPLQVQQLGKPITIYRNLFSFIFAIIIGLLIGWIL